MKRAIMMDKKDNVATALTVIEPGDEVEVISVKREAVKQLTARSPLPLGHKIALFPIAKDSPVIKYGTAIGKAFEDISVGDHVHVHKSGHRPISGVLKNRDDYLETVPPGGGLFLQEGVFTLNCRP